MELQVRTDDTGTHLFWSGDYTCQFEKREMTHAQRLAELRLITSRKPIMNTWHLLVENARRFSQVIRILYDTELDARFDSAVAYHYMFDVTAPLRRLAKCVLRFNRLNKALYRSPEHRLPIAGYDLAVSPHVTVPYPWWNGRRIHWRILSNSAAGSASANSKTQEECERWDGFRAIWATNKPNRMATVLVETLVRAVEIRRPKIAHTSLELFRWYSRPVG